MTPDALYSLFIRCEDKSADLYLNLSIRFHDQSDLSWFWVDMAMGDKQQAGLLQYCLENRMFAQPLPPVGEVLKVQRRLDDLESRTSDPSLSVDGAFDIAIQLETPDVLELRRQLMQPIQGPDLVMQKKEELSRESLRGKLRSACERFAVSPLTRARLESLT